MTYIFEAIVVVIVLNAILQMLFGNSGDGGLLGQIGRFYERIRSRLRGQA